MYMDKLICSISGNRGMHLLFMQEWMIQTSYARFFFRKFPHARYDVNSVLWKRWILQVPYGLKEGM
jgi:hypothetical protein